MMNYNLTDIHFHTNDSFDAYENNGYQIFNLDLIIKSMINNNIGEVKLVCKTDHNILNYGKYIADRVAFGSNGINYLPGIEVNGNDKIHWLFIFSEAELSKTTRGELKGHILEKEIYTKVFRYDMTTDLIPQARQVQNSPINLEEFLSILHDLKISYLAIPHLNKSGGFYTKIKSNEVLFTEIINYLNDNVICGFESKQQKRFIKDNIEETQRNINLVSDELIQAKTPEEYSKISLEIAKRIKHLNKMTVLNDGVNRNGVSVIYGSDFHGKETISDYQNCIGNLFYMHAESTFEGLKLSLLDQESRIFTVEEYNRYKKTSNYVISHIDFSVNNKPLTIHFGDNMNSIIGLLLIP